MFTSCCLVSKNQVLEEPRIPVSVMFETCVTANIEDFVVRSVCDTAGSFTYCFWWSSRWYFPWFPAWPACFCSNTPHVAFGMSNHENIRFALSFNYAFEMSVRSGLFWWAKISPNLILQVPLKKCFKLFQNCISSADFYRKLLGKDYCTYVIYFFNQRWRTKHTLLTSNAVLNFENDKKV